MIWDFIRALMLMLLFAFGGQLDAPSNEGIGVHSTPSPQQVELRPQFEVRPLQPVVGPTVPCGTDAECYALNPHIVEDPECEWVDGECLPLD